MAHPDPTEGCLRCREARRAKLGEPQLTLMLVSRAIMAPWTLQFDRPCLLTSWSAGHLDLAVVKGFLASFGEDGDWVKPSDSRHTGAESMAVIAGPAGTTQLLK